MSKRLKVFLSSTYIGLMDERLAAFEAIDIAGYDPIEYSELDKGDESHWHRIKRDIDNCDILLLILGNYPGTIEPNNGLYYVQLEYEYALEKRIPIFPFVKTYVGNESLKETNENFKLKELVLSRQDVHRFENITELKLLIIKSLLTFRKSEKFISIQNETVSSFNPLDIIESYISLPLQEQIQYYYQDSIHNNEYALLRETDLSSKTHSIIIEINSNYYNGIRETKSWIRNTIYKIIQHNKNESLDDDKYIIHPYIYATLTSGSIMYLLQNDANHFHEDDIISKSDTKFSFKEKRRAIHQIWPDFEAKAFIDRSINTIKAYPAHNAFNAVGEGITWAVIDSGIDFTHPHLSTNLIHNNFHYDFVSGSSPLHDSTGHGTHVAGIIAGFQQAKNGDKLKIYRPFRNAKNKINYELEEVTSISGMAPLCNLVSLKVLNNDNKAETKKIINAISHVQEINSYGRDIKIHGVNLSLGYDFLARWFACGQSPLCKEVNHLVRSGVVVVVAAGNDGYGIIDSDSGRRHSGLSLSIADPGNAELAITVGSTHRDQPHTYGVSYFSSKGPTGDGRLKPDIVAPGERIISCAAGKKIKSLKLPIDAEISGIYTEDSGTSMATPHVSGAIAAFLSVHREFIGKPEEIKQLFLRTATDLKRDRNFQGYGLIDLMRAIQAI